MTNQILPPLNLPTQGGPNPTPQPGGPLPLTGDVSGTTDNNQVSEIQGVPITMSGAADGDVLTYSALGDLLSLQPPSGGGTLGGDVTGPVGSNTVSSIQGLQVFVSNQQPNNVLTFAEGVLALEPVPGSTLNGDVTGSSTSNTVSSLQGLTLLTGPTFIDGQTIVWNDNDGKLELRQLQASQVLPYTSTDPLPTPANTGAMIFDTTENNPYWWTGSAWTAIPLSGDVQGQSNDNEIGRLQGQNLSLSDFTDGNVITWDASANEYVLLPVTLGGDVVGSATSNTLFRIQGHVLDTTNTVDGYVITYTAAGSEFTLQPVPSSGSSILVGDVTGTTDHNQISQLQGKNISLTDFTDGNVIAWNAGESEYVLQPVSVTLAGDVVNPSTSSFIASIQGKNVNLIVPSPTDGAVLAWSQTNSNITFQQPFQPEFIYANVTSPISNPTTGTNVPLALVTSNTNSFLTGNQTSFDLHFPSNVLPTVSFKLTASLGSLYDGSFTYQWWDLTNNVGLGNVAGNIGGGTSLDAVAIVPYNYAGNITIQVALQLTFVNGTTFIGEGTAGGFIGPWAIIETLGIPKIAGG